VCVRVCARAFEYACYNAAVPGTHPASAGSFPDAATFVLLFFFFLPQPSPREQWAGMLKPVRHRADAHCWRCSLSTQGIEHTRRLHKRLRKRGPTIGCVRTGARQLHRTGLAHLRQLQRTGLAPPRSALPPATRPSHPLFSDPAHGPRKAASLEGTRQFSRAQ
jgi:hypothetical protein